MKDIKNYEGLYAITEDGRVWSYKNNKFLKLGNHHSGYLNIRLFKDGFSKIYSVHRLVAEAYLDNPNNWPCVNHKNEIKTDNRAENLEFCTVRYNSTYGTSRTRCAEKLKKNVYCEELDKTFDSACDAAEELGFKRANIWCALSGRTETAYGYHWRYV